MAIDKAVDSAALDSALTYTADRIRVKTGDTAQIAWDNDKGFGDAVDAISGGGAQTSDPREVYQGTRPAEWLRLPDYDKVADNTVYFLLRLSPYGTNKVSFSFRIAYGATGVCTLTAGTVSSGEFVPFESDSVVSVNGIGNTEVNIQRTFNYSDYDTEMSDGTKQVVVQLHTTAALKRINFTGSEWRNNRGILDIVLRATQEEAYSFRAGSNQRDCLYYYTFGKDMPTTLKSIKYVQAQNGVVGIPNGNSLYLTQLVKILGTSKVFSGSERFRDCNNLVELTCDISEATTFANAFRNTCYSLRRLLFTGGESLTSFPSDISLAYTALEADAILAFFNTLPDISTSDTARTITLTNTPAVSEGIPDDTLAVATNKGWTVVTA